MRLIKTLQNKKHFSICFTFTQKSNIMKILIEFFILLPETMLNINFRETTLYTLLRIFSVKWYFTKNKKIL